MNEVLITVNDVGGSANDVSIPTDMGLNLMEALKAHGYPILATCGGMALCGTCHVLVEQGGELLQVPGEAETAMLDSLPDPQENSRLACQIRVTTALNGLSIRLAPQE